MILQAQMDPEYEDSVQIVNAWWGLKPSRRLIMETPSQIKATFIADDSVSWKQQLRASMTSEETFQSIRALLRMQTVNSKRSEALILIQVKTDVLTKYRRRSVLLHPATSFN